MSWNSPKNCQEMADSTRAGLTWRAKGLAADYVAVLSYSGMAGMLDGSHPLSDHVLTGAERYRDDYMATGNREPHPSVVVYYVRDTATRRVVLARQADGTILDELDTARPDLRQSTRDLLRAAFKEGGERDPRERDRK